MLVLRRLMIPLCKPGGLNKVLTHRVAFSYSSRITNLRRIDRMPGHFDRHHRDPLWHRLDSSHHYASDRYLRDSSAPLLRDSKDTVDLLSS